MTMHSKIETADAIAQAAPFIGTPLDRPSGGRAYVVAVRADEAQSFTLIGGPAPMSRNRFVLTVASETHVSEMSEHIAAPMIYRAQGAAYISEAEAAALWERAKLAMAASQSAAMEASEKARQARQSAEAELALYRPEWAQAAIIAELDHDDSDSMTDYFNHRTSRRVVIGWSKHSRDLFPELRKAAATFAETADLATAPENAEHREKYSMGAGFYLKNGWRDSDGWSVKKRNLRHLTCDALEFSDAAKGVAPDPLGETASPIVGIQTNGRFAIEQHTHTKKGFAMFICIMAERVERAEYDRLLDTARELGGWYSRPWGATPGGFAFKSEEKAREFSTSGQPDDLPPTGGKPDQVPSVRAKVARTPTTSASPAAKFREMADALQGQIDDRFRDRLSNTPKRARQAAEARQEGVEIERAQKILRALADCHDAGTVPACLAKVRTKAAMLQLAKEEIDRSRGGYYDAGQPLGRPYQWGEPEQVAQAAAAWALLSAPIDGDRAQAEELRRKLEALRFARIPGYFPTPAALVARMIEAADLSPGARVVEPSAGSGAIADALMAEGFAVECVEQHSSLCDILAAKGHNLIRGDFLQIEPCGLYDSAVMNPPFENGQDLQHVRHAWGWIKAGGSLVAIMGAGVMFRQDRRYSEFREWVDSLGGEFVEIPAGTFKDSGTGVASVMLTLSKD